MQQELFDTQGVDEGIQLNMKDADVSYYPSFLLADQALHYFNVLSQQLTWREEHIQLFGKLFKVPRLQAWYGDDDASYRYSNLSMQPNNWTGSLLELKALCEHKTQHSFNSVLANWYRDGQDSMGMHADNEPELGHRPCIASLSLGQERTLVFAHKHSKEKLRLPLASGSLLIMKGKTQECWLHGIAKTKRPLLGRINLTFRSIIN
ncbi:MAG: alpha-ketoglutarate-dependent dioxygenase AlkB [Paraglaciecola sp.]|uniref:alpha-ketoglutarate-dependent dioxygenase AlkB family protein n=1 Tax=Paraglaciecola sp. TaxID=1920173 RepID=UPI0027400EA8|nr:alpha-ketoglutarate-dependent dioxygenase AlkB [Paraglaciecola sp.]MDP5032551.1 alpha-ketoglutarate-dependent dioxygenase AlkB [Paraglaciecola sp.]MDP5129471.1 alpha-ketoglutarate-dependent dioxygenase AlkB [Paraglaciecola sp.]